MASRIVAAVLLLYLCAAGQQPAIDTIAAQWMQESKAPGLAIAVVRPGEPDYLRGYGVRELGASGAVTPDTIFGIGSLTKAFTATAMAVLADEGKLAWDDPVRKHLVYFKLSDPLADANVALRDLVTHRTGLAGHDLLWQSAPWTLEETIRRAASLKPSHGFRARYQYNNIMYNAAGLAAAAAAGSTWQDLVRSRIFVPLGMASTVLTSGEAQAAPDHATPHRDGRPAAWYDDDRQIRPAGSIKSTARDLARWIHLQLGNGEADGRRLVSERQLQETRTPQIVTGGGPFEAYGMGWALSAYHGRPMVSHGGAVPGFRAHLALLPREGIGVVVLTNSETQVGDVAIAVLDHLTGEKTDRASRQAPVSRRGSPNPDSRPLAAYAGVYIDPAYGMVRVTLANGALRLRWSSFDFALTQFSGDTFDVENHWPVEQQQVEFTPAGLKAFGTEFRRVDYGRMAERILRALKLEAAERVVARYDPEYFSDVVPALQKRIPGLRLLAAREPVNEKLLDETGVYLWLPLGPTARELAPAERQALARWLDRGGARREIHFHWSDGSRAADGLAGVHLPVNDDLYERALDIDYHLLNRAQDRAIEWLRQGTVRIHTLAGTDFMFRIGLNRPFNKQNGDASPERMRAARIRIDREIELPAGVLRVAPVEESAHGVIVLPEARFGGVMAKKVMLYVDNGRITRIRADQGQEAVEAALKASGDAAMQFREFCLGFNPKLPGLAYFGYGAGAVRLSLGDNEELGGKVRGGFVRWFFFPDASVHVDGKYLVRDGKLLF